MAVLSVTAGEIMSATVGATSGIFLVVTRIKSKGAASPFETSGTALVTI